MRRRLAAGLVAVAVVLVGWGVALGAGVSGGEQEAQEVDLTGFSGPPAEVASARAATQAVLDGQLAVGAMPRSMTRRTVGRAGRHAHLEAYVKRAYDLYAQERVRKELLTAVEKAESDPGYQSYERAEFVVTEWTGVRVQGDGASVAVRGHDEFHSTGEPSTSGPDTKVWLELTRSPDGFEGWQVIDTWSLSSDEGVS